ncbi:tRNA (cytosine-5-)-methyltransferase NCL1 [Ophiocordyceps camponoti-floridani]|uniref:Nucleolar protein 2 n=1 Tax=Ophiocordyceps camponoti-floridani TaxID=2030778 RepID=A0A8H4Q1N7_9HYPO|nr:tRNA (cytosine-5-)-methyltransferase NCL1 [Ophiocordyceps camponoti-floridani]
MGAGRRMSRKQGPPEALSEEHFARLKRKAGLPVDRPSEEPKKRRRTAKGAEAKKGERNGSVGSKKGQKKEKRPTNGKVNGNGKYKGKKPPPASDLSPEADELDDEFDLDKMAPSTDEEDDEVREGKGPRLGADFLGSDSEQDSSVFDSDDEAITRKHVFSEDEDESDAEAKLTAANMESLSRQLDRAAADDAAADAAEMAESALQTNMTGEKPPQVLDDEEDGTQTKSNPLLLAPDLQLLRLRMTETVRVLDDFAKLSEQGRSRSEYTAQLIKDICAYYGYSEYLAEKLYGLFSPREALAFFEANETARPVVIRTNTLRTHRRDLAQALINRGVTLEPVGKWSKVGLQVFESSVPLGATPEYLAGHYILQAASSFLPCVALDPQERERVLDMAAAPGGKTTYMAAMMKNTGVIVANDANKARAKGLIGNIHRLGASNVIVSNYDARLFPKPMGGFDRVLLDAPCSGTGVIAKDASIKTNKTETDFLRLPHVQKQLLLSAIDSVNHSSRSGGYLVYSTCSVTVEENEQVVQYALSRRPNVRLVETGLAFGKEGFTSFRGKRFDASLRFTRRYYPHAHNVDGFFVAKFKKIAASPTTTTSTSTTSTTTTTTTTKAETTTEDGDVVAEALHQKIPLAADDDNGKDEEGDGFGGWHDEEDKLYMERGRRNAMRRRGLDPKCDGKAAASKGNK